MSAFYAMYPIGGSGGGGGGTPSGPAGSVQFSDGAAFDSDPDFVWDDSTKTLILGDLVNPGLSTASLKVGRDIDPVVDSSYADILTDARAHVTANTTTTISNMNNTLFGLVDSGFTQSGGLVNINNVIDRTNPADLGTISITAGMYNSFAQANGAKSTFAYSAYLAGTHSIDAAGTVGSVFDFYALSSTIAPGAVTNRYGIYLEADTNYTKQNWLSGTTVLGGTSYTPPAGETLVIDGSTRGFKSSTDDNAIGAQFSATTDTTVNGSNNTHGVQSVATATIQSGATNDKAIAGFLATVTRGDGTDDGNADLVVGYEAVIFHNAGAAGTTDDLVAYDTGVITQAGTITNLYDFRSERIAAGGTVTNHYGVYITDDPVTPVKNWLSGSTQLGGGALGAFAEILNVEGSILVDGDVKSTAIAGSNLGETFIPFGSAFVQDGYFIRPASGAVGDKKGIYWLVESPELSDGSANITAERTGVSGAPYDLIFRTTDSHPTIFERMRILSTGTVVVAGTLTASSVIPADGATGTFTTVDLKTVTVTNGIITSIV